MRVLPVVAALASVVVVAAGCGGSGGDEASDSDSSSSLSVGYLNSVGSQGYPACVVEGMKAAAADADVDFTELTTTYDAQEELNNTQALLTRKTDIILNWPVSPATGAAVAQQVNQGGSDYFAFFAPFDGDKSEILGEAAQDGNAYGKALGDWVVQNKPDAVVLDLYGSDADAGSQETRKGFQSALDGSAVTIKQAAETNWDPEQAGKLALQLLPANPDVTLVVTQNDDMALAVSRSIKQLGLEDKVEVESVLISTTAGADAVKSGELKYGVYDSAYGNGYTALMNALALKQGKEPEEIVDLEPAVTDPTGVKLCG